jgi:hypothetical protein
VVIGLSHSDLSKQEVEVIGQESNPSNPYNFKDLRWDCSGLAARDLSTKQILRHRIEIYTSILSGSSLPLKGQVWLQVFTSLPMATIQK